MQRVYLKIGVHILIITAMVGMCCTPKLFDNSRNDSTRSRQTTTGLENTATSQGSQSTNQGVGDIIAAPGSGVLVLQTGEAGILGLILVGGFTAWYVVRQKHDTEYKTARRLLQAIESEQAHHKVRDHIEFANIIRGVKRKVQIGGECGNERQDRVEHNIQCHLEKMGCLKKGAA